METPFSCCLILSSFARRCSGPDPYRTQNWVHHPYTTSKIGVGNLTWIYIKYVRRYTYHVRCQKFLIFILWTESPDLCTPDREDLSDPKHSQTLTRLHTSIN